jgi:hypothetical protein
LNSPINATQGGATFIRWRLPAAIGGNVNTITNRAVYLFPSDQPSAECSGLPSTGCVHDRLWRQGSPPTAGFTWAESRTLEDLIFAQFRRSRLFHGRQSAHYLPVSWIGHDADSARGGLHDHVPRWGHAGGRQFRIPDSDRRASQHVVVRRCGYGWSLAKEWTNAVIQRE